MLSVRIKYSLIPWKCKYKIIPSCGNQFSGVLHIYIGSGLREGYGMGKDIVRMASMQPGERGRIAGLHVAGDIGQRLKDMGFVKGAGIECVYDSPFGDPSAYFVRGTLVAVRKEDAEGIEVETERQVRGRGEGEWH